jgi:hypothetical protein
MTLFTDAEVQLAIIVKHHGIKKGRNNKDDNILFYLHNRFVFKVNGPLTLAATKPGTKN